MKPDSVIFDLDGTLWDSTETCAKAWNLTLKNLGEVYRPIVAADVASIMGLTPAEISEKLFLELPSARRTQIVRACLDEESDLIPTLGGILYDGVREGLLKLSQHYPLYIVSNCEPEYLECFLNWSALRAHFKDYESHGRTGLSKAENIKLVCQRNNLNSALYVGDTHKDQLSAQAAGVSYIHVNYGFGRPVSECREADSFEELVANLT